jgi:hypothetical protein
MTASRSGANAAAIDGLSDQLRKGRIGRREFLTKLASLGLSIAAASALATDVMAADSRVPRGTALSKPPVRFGVEIRFPSSLKFSKRERQQLAKEFENSLAEAIRKGSGERARSVEVEAKEIEVVMSHEIK